MNESLEEKAEEVSETYVFRPLCFGAGALLLGYLCEEFTGRESLIQNILNSLWMGLPILVGSDVYYKPKERLNVVETGILYVGLTAGQTLRNFLY